MSDIDAVAVLVASIVTLGGMVAVGGWWLRRQK